MWAVHVAWSGNSQLFVERRPGGLVTVGGGRAAAAGRGRARDGRVVRDAVGRPRGVGCGHGRCWRPSCTAIARALAAHPRAPRPVISNVWEAVYFDHDLDRLRELADLAAEVGIERFVLDDGWFGARRDDTRGLGDWTVSPDAWPDGLGPLIDHVRARGLSFGLWFEPEMVNPDSDLFRAHPDWILGARRPAALGATSSCSTSADPRCATTCSTAIDAVLLGVPDRLRQVGPQPRTARRVVRPAGAAGAHARRSATTSCSTGCAPHTRPSSGRAARPAADGSISACSSGSSGCGRPTSPMPCHGRRFSVGRRS